MPVLSVPLTLGATVPTIRLGTDYGGWIIPRSILKPGATAVLAGAGEDISFDVALNRHGLHCLIVDPTPRAVQHVESVLAAARTGAMVAINHSPTDNYELAGFDPSRAEFLPVGLWTANQTKQFHPPANPTSVSHSIDNLLATEGGFEAPCLTLDTLLADRGLAGIDLLKLDIEGAEYAVLDALFDSVHVDRLSVLCVEYHLPLDADAATLIARVAAQARTLCDHGLTLIAVDGPNLTFARI